MKQNYYLAWQENSGRNIAEKIDDARERFQERCGCTATVAYIGMGSPLPEGYDIMVQRSSFCRPGIIWVGIDELPARSQWVP